jgi:hypothetical protein
MGSQRIPTPRKQKVTVHMPVNHAPTRTRIYTAPKGHKDIVAWIRLTVNKIFRRK